MLKAFTELNLPNSELIFVGQVDDEIKKILGKYYSMNNIKFYKKQSQNKLNSFYNEADIFVLFSLEEGLSMVQIQAMACGLPVICTHNTGGSEIVDHGINGFVLPIRNIDLLKKMKINAYKKAQKFLSWSIYGKKIIKFYKKVITKH